MLYIPRGVANGYVTLKDDTEVHYQTSHAYVAAAQRGVRWNDSAFDIVWPTTVEIISERDRHFPDYDERDHGD
jgi:dTDP-4-dehydrorhamnose 3,5-epimerase